jgi:hypothetical protein
MLRFVNPENWKRGIALVILWGYGYALVLWPLLFWLSTLLAKFTGEPWPAPPLPPWEQLIAGTTTLAAVGGIETWRERQRPVPKESA